MALGVTFFIVAILVVAVWLIIEFKRMKHKIIAIALIALIIFTYVSFTASIKGTDLDFKTIDGWKTAGTLYFSWLGGVFQNLKSVTSYAIHQDWKIDKNVTVKTKEEREKEKETQAIWDQL